MRFRTFLTYLSLLPLSACTRSCNYYDNNEEFAQAKLPAYSETGAGTLGCMLGSQTWTVLGSHYVTRIGSPWQANGLEVDGRYAIPPYVAATGRMTGVRDSKVFYDMSLTLAFRPTDTLGGLHLLGADTTRQYTGRFVEQLVATNLMTLDGYQSSNRRPVRLLVRKLDRQQRSISGTFAGMLYNTSNGQDSLSVADGRFDFQY